MTIDQGSTGAGGHIYALRYSDGTVKIGRSISPIRRAATHRAAGARFGVAVTDEWISTRHHEWRENETALLDWCLRQPGASVRSGAEYVTGLDHAAIVDYATSSLPCSDAHEPLPLRALPSVVDPAERPSWSAPAMTTADAMTVGARLHDHVVHERLAASGLLTSDVLAALAGASVATATVVGQAVDDWTMWTLDGTLDDHEVDHLVSYVGRELDSGACSRPDAAPLDDGLRLSLALSRRWSTMARLSHG